MNAARQRQSWGRGGGRGGGRGRWRKEGRREALEGGRIRGREAFFLFSLLSSFCLLFCWSRKRSSSSRMRGRRGARRWEPNELRENKCNMKYASKDGRLRRHNQITGRALIWRERERRNRKEDTATREDARREQTMNKDTTQRGCTDGHIRSICCCQTNENLQVDRDAARRKNRWRQKLRQHKKGIHTWHRCGTLIGAKMSRQFHFEEPFFNTLLQHRYTQWAIQQQLIDDAQRDNNNTRKQKRKNEKEECIRNEDLREAIIVLSVSEREWERSARMNPDLIIMEHSHTDIAMRLKTLSIRHQPRPVNNMLTLQEHK